MAPSAQRHVSKQMPLPGGDLAVGSGSGWKKESRKKELPAGLRWRPVRPTIEDRYGHETVSGHAMLEVEKHGFEQMSIVGCTTGGGDGMETRGPQPTQSGT